MHECLLRWAALQHRDGSSNDNNGPFAIISQRAKDIVYINATSTRECTFALGFAREYA
jgi:hypothetical protein